MGVFLLAAGFWGRVHAQLLGGPEAARSEELTHRLRLTSQNHLLAQHLSRVTRRHALVIGNADYADDRLANAVNDAEDVARSLQEIGFSVTLVRNADRRTIDDAVETFSSRLGPGDIGLFYFSGHGVQVDGENYLVPINAKLRRQADTQYDAVPLGKVINAVEGTRATAKIIILDACRNNPFYRRWRPSARSATTRGLAAPLTSGSGGTLIAFATAPGMVAADGIGNSSNSPFTTHLLKHIKTPNLDVYRLFRRVREGVARVTSNEQIPWVSESLTGEDLYLNPITTQTGLSVASSPQRRDPPIPMLPDPASRTSPLAKPKPLHSPVFTEPQSSLISSSTGVDYSRLQMLLSKKSYREADELTLKLLLASARSRRQDWMNRDWLESGDIQKLNCSDLAIVDKLWAGYSNNKLGLSVQSKIWNDARDRSSSIPATYLEFSRRVHWMLPSSGSSGINYISKYDINYKTPPPGHLPIQLTYPLSEGWSDGGLYTNLHLLYARYNRCSFQRGNA
jgi:hypothetical protein